MCMFIVPAIVVGLEWHYYCNCFFIIIRERLKSLQRNQEQMQYHGNHTGRGVGTPTTPDLLSTYHDSMGRVSPSSLLDEIVETEGTTSPVLK